MLIFVVVIVTTVKAYNRQIYILIKTYRRSAFFLMAGKPLRGWGCNLQNRPYRTGQPVR